jgi:hypothetical protein
VRAWIRRRDEVLLKNLQEIARQFGRHYDNLDRAFLATARFSGWLPPIDPETGVDAETGTQRVGAAFDNLFRALEEDPVMGGLKIKRARGNQPEPYKRQTLDTLICLGVPRDRSETLLRMAGVKPPEK